MTSSVRVRLRAQTRRKEGYSQNLIDPWPPKVGGGAGRGNESSADLLRTSWASLKPDSREFGQVIAASNSSKMVGEGSLFEQWAHVPVTHVGHFKPPPDALLSELRSKDRRSAKEWDYVNEA